MPRGSAEAVGLQVGIQLVRVTFIKIFLMVGSYARLFEDSV